MYWFVLMFFRVPMLLDISFRSHPKDAECVNEASASPLKGGSDCAAAACTGYTSTYHPFCVNSYSRLVLAQNLCGCGSRPFAGPYHLALALVETSDAQMFPAMLQS